MQRLVFSARLRLVSTDAGGRKTAIRSNYRPTFDLGGTWQGLPTLNDGRVMLVDREELAPGDEGTVTIEPLFPEFWGTLRTGLVIPMQEGSRIVGYATITDVTRSENFMPVVTTFVCRVREFCSFIEEAAKSPLHERMLNARQRLLDLYSAAVLLPNVEPASDGKEPPSPTPPEGWQSFEAFETYWEVFDPYEMEEPVAGSLSDNLLDVFRDVRRGLRQWEHGEEAAAIWGWRFSFETHWGDHAVDALRALHRACLRNGS